VLFHDTIFYNIKYGRLDATDEEVDEAARHAPYTAMHYHAPLPCTHSMHCHAL
jgi:ABC-type multidrug transport system fused ATPase/permease subunit